MNQNILEWLDPPLFDQQMVFDKEADLNACTWGDKVLNAYMWTNGGSPSGWLPKLFTGCVGAVTMLAMCHYVSLEFYILRQSVHGQLKGVIKKAKLKNKIFFFIGMS